MIIIETFERPAAPSTRPSSPIIDTSWCRSWHQDPDCGAPWPPVLDREATGSAQRRFWPTLLPRIPMPALPQSRSPCHSVTIGDRLTW